MLHPERFTNINKHLLMVSPQSWRPCHRRSPLGIIARSNFRNSRFTGELNAKLIILVKKETWACLRPGVAHQRKTTALGLEAFLIANVLEVFKTRRFLPGWRGSISISAYLIKKPSMRDDVQILTLWAWRAGQKFIRIVLAAMGLVVEKNRAEGRSFTPCHGRSSEYKANSK